jgi:hypothetical protein
MPEEKGLLGRNGFNGLNRSGSVSEGSCEYCNEPWGSMNFWLILEYFIG